MPPHRTKAASGRVRHRLATIEARVSHLSKAHQATGCESPATDPRCRELLAAARRQRARNGGQRQKKALTLDPLEKLLRTCEVDIEVAAARDRLAGYRDRALLLVTWAAGGRRRSEAVSLCVKDLREDAGKYVWKLGHSKTNQDGAAQENYPIAGRAAEALTAWLQIAGIKAGPVLRAIDRHGHLANNWGATPVVFSTDPEVGGTRSRSRWTLNRLERRAGHGREWAL